MTNKQQKANLQWWADRREHELNIISAKTEEEINKKLDKYYLSVMKQVMADFESVYNALLAQLEKGEQPSVSKLYNLDKYWQMQAKLRVLCEQLGNKEVELLSKQFENQWEETYKASALPSELAFNQVSESNAKAMINTIWLADNKTFSTRVWNNVEDLIATLDEELISVVTAGRSTNDLRKQLMERFNVSRSRANTLIRTEVCHIQTAAAEKRYKDDGIEEYVFLGREEHDLGCDCKKHSGKVFRFDDPKAPKPPLHPNCRCRMAPVPKNDILRRRAEEVLEIERAKKAKKIEADELRKQAKQLREQARILKKEGKHEQAALLESEARALELRYKEIYKQISN
jgi:SPP1 gp7 family putative phage head morphogenesis protein